MSTFHTHNHLSRGSFRQELGNIFPSGLNQTVVPAAEPISRTEAKNHLRVDGSDDDDLIDGLIAAARDYCETVTRRQFVNATYELFVDGFPGEFRMPKPPLSSVTSITYKDTDDSTQTLATSEYDVDTNRIVGRIVPAFEVLWPFTRNEINTVTVTFIAGYGAAAAVPDIIKSAIYLMLTDLYEHRSAGTEVTGGRNLSVAPNPTVDRLLAAFKVPEVA